MSNPDNFSIWYRIRMTVIYNLLHLGGPARLDEAQDPRLQLEREYLRRKEVHEAHREGRPVRPVVASASRSKGADPLVACVALGILAVVGLAFFIIFA